MNHVGRIPDGRFAGLRLPDPRVSCRTAEGQMKLYRIDKLAKRDGAIVKRKHVLAASDKEAVQHAANSDDCPVCDVSRDGRKIGSIL